MLFTSAHASIQASFDISALVVNLFVVKLSSISSASSTTFHTAPFTEVTASVASTFVQFQA